MAEIRSKIRMVESRTVSAMRSARSELVKATMPMGKTSGLERAKRVSSCWMEILLSAMVGARSQGLGTFFS